RLSGGGLLVEGRGGEHGQIRGAGDRMALREVLGLQAKRAETRAVLGAGVEQLRGLGHARQGGEGVGQGMAIGPGEPGGGFGCHGRDWFLILRRVRRLCIPTQWYVANVAARVGTELAIGRTGSRSVMGTLDSDGSRQ